MPSTMQLATSATRLPPGRNRLSCRLMLATILATSIPLGAAWAGPTDRTLHSFSGGKDGAFPHSTLLMDQAGNLYGTATEGGDVADCPRSSDPANDCGVVFELVPPAAGKTIWKETVLHTFKEDKNGAGPVAGLVADESGVLYGMAAESTGAPYGTVFSMSPPATGKTTWTFTVIHRFDGTDGLVPSGRLVRSKATGALYGVTLEGGSASLGTAFKLTPPGEGQSRWAITVLHTFAGGDDGVYPSGSLAIDGSGAVYGTTQSGGAHKSGVVYRLAPPAAGKSAWKETLLHVFTGGADGGQPTDSGLILDQAGALYGTTQVGGDRSLGTVFRLAPPVAGHITWKETVLHNFGAINDGSSPMADLTIDTAGALYGTTASGGVAGYGTVFKLTPPAPGGKLWQEKVLHSFDYAPQGGAPDSGAVLLDTAGRIYGTASQGGNLDVCQGGGCGTVFQITP